MGGTTPGHTKAGNWSPGARPSSQQMVRDGSLLNLGNNDSNGEERYTPREESHGDQAAKKARKIALSSVQRSEIQSPSDPEPGEPVEFPKLRVAARN